MTLLEDLRRNANPESGGIHIADVEQILTKHNVQSAVELYEMARQNVVMDINGTRFAWHGGFWWTTNYDLNPSLVQHESLNTAITYISERTKHE